MVVLVDSPQGELPVAANFRTEPALKISAADVKASPCICSGANQAGDPATKPVEVKEVASDPCAIPSLGIG